MADTTEFFNDILPRKVAEDPALELETGVFQFDIRGVGTWTLDLDSRTVTEGPHEQPHCKISTDQTTWESILDQPSKAMQAFMMGKLKASNVSLASKLQKILA